MLVRKPDRHRLTPDDWAQAALDAIARGGIDAVTVETIAGELGATKGSFYWHFRNRDALIQAALDRWEERRTDAVIEVLDREPSPAQRLRTLMEAAFERGPTDRAEIALLANPSHPAALRTIRRVTQRRITYISKQLEDLGWDSQDALDRAALIAYIYVGHIQMAHVVPRLITGEARQRQVAVAFDTLVSADTSLPAGKPS
jgi:AcrR family transcriptional regulator